MKIPSGMAIAAAIPTDAAVLGELLEAADSNPGRAFPVGRISQIRKMFMPRAASRTRAACPAG